MHIWDRLYNHTMDQLYHENNNNNQVNPLTLPSPIDNRKIFSLTSVSPFVRIAKKSEEKTKLKQRDEDETTPETTSSFIDVHAVLSKKPAATANHIPKPYVLPKGMPELPIYTTFFQMDPSKTYSVTYNVI